MQRSRWIWSVLVAMALSAPTAGCGARGGATATRTRTVAVAATATIATSSTAPAAAADSSTATPPATQATPPATQRCRASQLSAHLVEESPGAGQRYATLLVGNRNRVPCVLAGIPAVQLRGSDGRPLPTRVVGDRSRPSRPVTIVFDQQAKSQWHWGAIASGSEPTDGPCEPTPATLDLRPPGDTGSLQVDWPFDEVCGGGRIEVRPFAIVAGK